MNAQKLYTISLFQHLPEKEKRWLRLMAESYPLSFQQLKMLTEYCADMICWGAGSPALFHWPEVLDKASGKKAAALFFQQIKGGYEDLVNRPKKYGSSLEEDRTELAFVRKQAEAIDLVGNIMGTCPVASEKTRCCNLKTLDAVQQCGFGCSYCSIQSFYHANQIRFIRDLTHHLQNMELDPHKTYHIGTGQSSDSLMWGNHNGLLDTLYDFASVHPNIILEMKSKSGRIDYFLENKPPANIVFTWSLNPQKVIQHEEKGTASLEKRLSAARKLADVGCPVGFHFHPMVWYEGWQEEYTDLVDLLTATFSPEETVMISIGTLTFIKSVIKRIRTHLLPSTILQMPREEIGGKLSYPFAIKKEMFSTLYRAFPTEWKEGVFFYMCMEDIRLWELVFSRSYASNEAFEQDMLTSYSAKLRNINRKQAETEFSTVQGVSPGNLKS